MRGASDNDEQRVFVETQVEVCGRSAPRLLLDLPLWHPAGRHVGNLQLDMMSLGKKKKPDSAFYYREMTAGAPECSHSLVNVKKWIELLTTRGELLSLYRFSGLNEKKNY